MFDKRNLQASGKTMQFPCAGEVRQRQTNLPMPLLGLNICVPGRCFADEIFSVRLKAAAQAGVIG
jgi:hypothetical protein